MATLAAGSSYSFTMDPHAKLTLVVTGKATLSFVSAAPNLMSDFTVSQAQTKTYGPYGAIGTMTITAVDKSVEYTITPGVPMLSSDGTSLVSGDRNLAVTGVSVNHPGDGTNADAEFLVAAEVLQNASGGVLVIEPGNYIVTNSVFLPVNTSIHFKPGAILLPRAGGTFTANAIFLINTQNGTSWDVAFPNQRGAEVRNMRVLNDANPSLVVGGLITGAPVTLYNVYMSNVHFTAKTTDNYMDQFRIYGGYIQNTQGTDYQIELSAAGESFRMEDVSVYQSSEQKANLCKISNSGNAAIVNCSNGNYLIDTCRSVLISTMHNELGQVLLSNSSATISDSYFFEQGEPAIVCQSGGQRHHVALKNNRHIFMQGLDCVYYDHVEIDSNVALSVDNCYRQYTLVTDLAISETMGIGVRDSSGSLTAWNNYSWLLSERGYIGYGKYVQLDHAITTGTGSFISTVGTLTLSATAGTWSIASGTYHYQTQLITDKPRMLGRTDAGTIKSIATTLGGNGVILPLSYASKIRRGFVRLYRGTSASSYTAYVDLPVAAMSLIYDDGTYCNGMPWIARGAADVDSVSNTNDGQVRWTGTLIEWWHNAAPTGTVGTFVVGDRQMEIAPAASGNIGRVCVTGGSPGTWKTFGAIAA